MLCMWSKVNCQIKVLQVVMSHGYSMTLNWLSLSTKSFSYTNYHHQSGNKLFLNIYFHSSPWGYILSTLNASQYQRSRNNQIEATGSSLLFQWQRNDRDVYSDSNYSGTDTNILSIRQVKKSDEGHYRCTVRNQMEEPNIRGSSPNCLWGVIWLNFDFIYLRGHAVSFTLP